MPTKPFLKIIYFSCLVFIAVSSIVLIIIGKTKFWGPITELFLSILMFTICINGVFYKELIYKGTYFKGALPVFCGLMLGLVAVMLLVRFSVPEIIKLIIGSK